jgi:hypothetical protein
MKKITLIIMLFSFMLNSYGQGRMFPAQNNPLNAIPPPASTNIVLSQIVYTQSSIYGTNLAATNSGMTNGIFAETKQTGTNNGSEWVMMDLGSVKNVTSVVVGCDFTNTLEGGWGKSWTENRNVQYSSDNTNWTVAFNTGTFTQGLKTFNHSFSARYIRIFHNGFLSITEFYAIGN